MKSFLQKTITCTSKRANLTIALLMLFAGSSFAQSVISGQVVDEKGQIVRGASVYLDNTIDGATTDSTGKFSFSTEEKGGQTLVASEVGHETAGMPVTINGDIKNITLKMKSAARRLDEVVVTAGSFEASDRGKTVLTPLDIVTTAGSQADVIRAIQTLPGTQQQGTQTGLFVRGGDASEAAYIVDGLVAQNAFLSTAPGVAARSRFGPFQFKGVAFSSGGYSARYGQALSSVLELTSNDLPDKSTINTGINMAGIYFSGSKLFKTTSIEGSAYYNNLSPFYGIAKTNFDFYDVPKGGGGSANFTWKPNKNGILKARVTFSTFGSGTEVPDPTDSSNIKKVRYGVKNENVYSLLSYRQSFKDKWNLYVAGSYSYNKDDIKWNDMAIPNKDDRSQFRAEAKNYVTSRLSILVGTEMQHFMYSNSNPYNSNVYDFTETQLAGYAEADWSPVNWIAFKPGLRYEHSELLQKNALSPRFAMAIKAGRYGQVSLATGIFYQTVDPQYFLYGYRPDFQKAIHYIANYQYMHNDRTFRIEAYYKDYQQLVKDHDSTYTANPYNRRIYSTVDNSGHGYATGAELFWRDKKSIKNFDYWISYSYIDTRRLFKNYRVEAQPDFISDHNLNIVTKYYISKWQTMVNVTYNYATGRPYYNPLRTPIETYFLTDRAPEYHNLSIAVNYLTHVKKWFTVIYAGLDNVTNRKNVFGYRYQTDGTPVAIQPAIYRSFFIGVNFSLTEFDKDEL